MDEPIVVAIEARESAKAAHHRLDRMNGSIDRLGNAVENVDSKVDEILLRLAGQEGAARAKRGFVLSRRFVVSTVALLLTCPTVAALITLLLRSHS